MQTARIAEPITGDKLYQDRARSTLPILVRQAYSATPILYGDLAAELEMPNPRNLNYVLGSIGQTIKALAEKWKEGIPPIQCLVINKNTGLPGEGIGWFITDKADFRRLPKKQQRLLVEAELRKIFSYRKWLDVLREFGLQPMELSYSGVLASAANYKGGGEGDSHKQLKSYVSNNPNILNLPRKIAPGQTEFALPSGDSVDVLFINKDEWIGAEVKSAISTEADLVRGIFQCIKYRAVIEAYQASMNLAQSARVVLVLSGVLPPALVALKNMFGVEVLENIKKK